MSHPPASLQSALADRYRIERELGAGGMATVYLAHDLRHDRPVALKVLHPDLAHALGPERFQREIHVAARLQHPHIMTVHDSGESGGHLWFTMPFIEGESLRDRLDREKQLPVADAVRIAREAAGALDYAHRHGIVHRDVKPENILLADGHALMADFGIARALGAAADGERLTMTGTSIGTAAYMSPEQAAGASDVDGRSDIYSLAIVLYEMLAGATPFAAATPQASIARRFTDTPAPIRSLRDTVPVHVESALQEALARTAADRFSTARGFGDALGGAGMLGDPIATGAARPRDDDEQSLRAAKPRGNRVAAALILGLAIGGGALFAWTRTSGDAPSAADIRAASTESAGAVRIAVLPFENLGDSTDAYFADGVTDAVRGKLAAISGLEVIARASSEEYRAGTKGPGQIADELDVHYLLTGTVRWVKQPDGTSRVQVRPELVEIGDGDARTRWGQAFNAPLTDVFEVQEQIAGQVSSALDVALGASDRQEVAERPTSDLIAYDFYLQADAIVGSDAASVRRLTGLLERAVQRDSMFVLAWSRLARARAYLYATSTQRPSMAELREPVERTIALAPEAATTYKARLGYALNVENDNAKALAIATEAIKRYPDDLELIRWLGATHAGLANNDTAVALLRRAAALDPRNVHTLRMLGSVLTVAGKPTEARELLQRAFVLAPGDLITVQVLLSGWVADGDLAGARRTLNTAVPPEGRAALLAHAAMYGDRYWLLDRAQQDTVLGLDVGRFEGDAGSRALVFAQILQARGDTSGAHRWADSAARAFVQLAGTSTDPQLKSLAGLAFAYQGRHDEARRWLERGIAESAPVGGESAAYGHELSARSRLLAGDEAGALAALEAWAPLRGATAAGYARLHPEFARLRGNPRFERIVGR